MTTCLKQTLYKWTDKFTTPSRLKIITSLKGLSLFYCSDIIVIRSLKIKHWWNAFLSSKNV